MKKQTILIFLIIIFYCISVFSQNSEWQLDTTADLLDAINGDYTLELATLSPNGQLIAWIETDSLCLFMVTSTEVECYAWEWDMEYMYAHEGYSSLYLYWSPNSNYLTIAKYPFVQGYDSDIWIFNTLDNTFKNLTEDNARGIVITSESSSIKPPIDYLPTWISSGQLVFFRTFPTQDILSGEIYSGLELHKINIDTGIEEFVLDLSEQFDFVTSASISPDGERLAFYANHLSSESGIWILDLQTLDISQIATSSLFLDSFFTWLEPVSLQPTHNSSLQWSPDGNHLIISMVWQTAQGISITGIYFVDIAEQTVQPLPDFSEIATPTTREEVENIFNTIPHASFIAPNGYTLYYLTGILESDEKKLYSVNFLEHNPVPIFINDIPFYQTYVAGIYHMSDNGNILIDGRTWLVFSEDRP